MPAKDGISNKFFNYSGRGTLETPLGNAIGTFVLYIDLEVIRYKRCMRGDIVKTNISHHAYPECFSKPCIELLVRQSQTVTAPYVLP